MPHVSFYSRTLCFMVLMLLSIGYGEVPKKILFLGNSYTSQSRGALQKMLAASEYKDSRFAFVTRGGATLQQHLADPATREKIAKGDWDVVVLQDQSQVPGLPGAHGESFQTAVDGLTTLIRGAGAEPVLFMTWGRRDGDGRNKYLYPDYETMQTKLTQAYRTAATRNKLEVAAVGEAWAVVRKTDGELGNALYRNDGSHPSGKGAALVTCVMFHTLFQAPLDSMKSPKGISAEEWKVMTDAVQASHPE